MAIGKAFLGSLRDTLRGRSPPELAAMRSILEAHTDANVTKSAVIADETDRHVVCVTIEDNGEASHTFVAVYKRTGVADVVEDDWEYRAKLPTPSE